MLDPQQWRDAYFVLQKSNLFICPLNDGAAEDIINLKRLQELSESSSRAARPPWTRTHAALPCLQGIASETVNHEKRDILVLVEKGR